MRRSNRQFSTESEDEISLASIKRYINFVIVRLDHIILDTPCPSLNYLSTKGELSGFKLAYQIPRGSRGNSQLDREVLANGDCSSLGRGDVDQILFKHKKVFPIEFDAELIEKWEKTTLQISLSTISASARLPIDRKSAKHLARVSVSLSELLVPPFQINRDCTIAGADFNGRLSLSIELGSRNVRVAEILSDLRRTKLDSTFTMNERKPARRTRSRSSSRCRAHSHETENQAPQGEPIYVPKAPVRSRPSTAQSITDYSNYVQNLRDTSPVPLRLDCSSQRKDIRKMYPSDDMSSENDSVFSASELHRRVNPGANNHGALQLELILHSARNLPLIQDKNGCWVPPMAFIQILGRDEQVVSSIAPRDSNPIWNWKGTFVISSERGNLLIKILHKIGDHIGSIGVVTLASPLYSFKEREFEISLTSMNASGDATISLSLNVQPIMRVTSSSNLPTAKVPSRNFQASNYQNENIEATTLFPDEGLPGTYLPYRRPRSITPPPSLRPLSTEALRNKLQDDVDELLNVINKLGR